MKHPLIRFATILALMSGLLARGSTLYVNLNSQNPTPPFSDWSIAATNIQDAIDASSDGDQIWVTNGVYQTGGRVMSEATTNRVALYKSVTVQSVNGPFLTTIQGRGAVNGPTAVRCAWLTNNAMLIGFTLTQGATGNSGSSTLLETGGAAWCASSNATIMNCIIVSNTAAYNGGGVYQGTLNTCLVNGNSSQYNIAGGAVYNATLNDCSVVSNACVGVTGCRATNCIIYYNSLLANFSGGTFSYCCTIPKPAGAGNLTNAPLLFQDGIRLSFESPCIGAGTSPVTSSDLFGTAWTNPPSIGCAEAAGTLLISKPQVRLTSIPIGFTASGATISGVGPFTFQWIKDGDIIQNDGHFNGTQSTNLSATGVSFADSGNYQLVANNSFGSITSAVAAVVIHCVNAAGANPVSPYTTWDTAATNIQDAITAAATNEVVLVTNGVYATGGKSIEGIITNRVSIDKPILVQSVNGAAATAIQGMWDPEHINGPAAIRCVWMIDNSILNGFTIVGGATRTNSPFSIGMGGGVSATSVNALVWNCIIATNFAHFSGGGASSGTFNHCTFVGNHVNGFFVSAGAGGGAASQSNLRNCLVIANIAEQTHGGGGGGGNSCNATNTAFIGNVAIGNGGAEYFGTLVNCTLSRNVGSNGAVTSAILTNCIVWGNTTSSGTANRSCTMSYCDSDPLPTGAGNVDMDPQLLADQIHLAPTSPCIGIGTTNGLAGTDIDGQPWNHPPSIGCDEWWPEPTITLAPTFVVGNPSRRTLSFSGAAGGQMLTFLWLKDGVLLQDNDHFVNSSTANLTLNNFGPEDSGMYQFAASNSFGMVTSQVSKVTIHSVDIGSANPIPPYTSWQTAATNIQDAIDAAVTGDIVLVTNGIFATGGKVTLGDLTNRVALDKALTVISVNGYADTVIEGAWDPISTNGPAAVRCAWLTNGAALNGFTLRNGATRSSSDLTGYGGGELTVTNATISNCVLTNNSAQSGGGGAASGTLNNCFLAYNFTPTGGAAYACNLNNCTLRNNHCSNPTGSAGVYFCTCRNSIITDNYRSLLGNPDYSLLNFPSFAANFFTNCCTSPLPPYGTGNITLNPLYLDFSGGFTLSPSSPCLGAGNPMFAMGYDLDGEPYLNPPAIGCDEINATNLPGPLSFGFPYLATNALVYHQVNFVGQFQGRPSEIDWSFGDGPTVTNLGAYTSHTWTNAGIYNVTLTAYNTDHPGGVSSNFLVTVNPFLSPSMHFNGIVSNAFEFDFPAQGLGLYTVQYATNLTPPVAWQDLQVFLFSTSNTIMTVRDPAITNAPRFYRIFGQ